VTVAGAPQATRRKAVRRHRRERQVLVFGILMIAISLVAFVALGVYRGEVKGPFSAPFVTPQADFTSDITLVCPPPDANPLKTSEVAVRVMNGTERAGIAGATLEVLEGRGFVPLGATNWTRQYADVARIMFGAEGVLKAYTLARQFPESELVLDDRENATVDVVLGERYETLVEPLNPQLDPDLILSADAQCLPVSQVEPQPAPNNYPKDPLAPEPTASPSPSPSA